ncbi:hypothetical protein GF354_00525 [Candidatus Peregrinibacteria bacterium]|nr:hypothetical protein [Candidatus Peregrinibacteria bacterium]
MKLKPHKIRIINLTLAFALIFFNTTGTFSAEIIVYTNESEELNSNTVILDNDNTGGDVILQFGQSLNERLYWNNTGTTFVFSDDLNLTGSLDVDGTITAGSGDIQLTDATGNIDGEQISNDTIDDDSIDFGMGIDQVGADDITMTDEFDNSANTNVQDVVDDVDAAIGNRTYTQDNYVTDAQSLTASIDALDQQVKLNSDASGGALDGTTSNTFTLDNNDTGGNVDLIFGTTVAQYLRHDGTLFHLSDNLNMELTGQVIEMGANSAADIYLSFDDDGASDRNFGWDDSETAFSTFNDELEFRTKQSATPPFTCGATYAGMQWMDTDTGITYVCDTSNSRNKWLSQSVMSLYGEEDGNCGNGQDIGSDADCSVDLGAMIGVDTAPPILGLYVPHPMTITGYGFSADDDGCDTGSFDIEVWSTGSNVNDNSYTLESTVATGLTGEAHNAGNLNVNVAGNQYINFGVDNNCGQNWDDFNVILYYKWRHD